MKAVDKSGRALRASFSRSRDIASRAKYPIKAFRLVLTALLFSMLIAPLSTIAAPTNQDVNQVLSNGCTAAPRNMSLSDFWESKMGVLEAWCDYPEITDSAVNGHPKPRAFLHGSANVPHDLDASNIISGDGVAGSELGFAPNTPINFGLYCSDVTDLVNASPADVAFSLRTWSSTCKLTNPALPMIPVFGGVDGNNPTFIGNQKTPDAIHISSGGNYGRAIDYFTPGGASTILAGGNVSYALPEMAGIIVALNTVMIAEGKMPLDRTTIKQVLDSSSDQVYMEVNGTRGLQNESQVTTLLQNPSNKYYGQIVNLPNAIEYALTGAITVPPPPPPPPPPGPTPAEIAAIMIPVYSLLFD